MARQSARSTTRVGLLWVTLCLVVLTSTHAAAARHRSQRRAPGLDERGEPVAEHHPHQEALPRVDQLRFAPLPSLQLQASPNRPLAGAVETAIVCWTNNYNAPAFDWIAAYSPVPTSPQGFRETLPVKFVNLTDLPGTDACRDMQLVNMRAPWVFVYMRGGYDAPVALATSNILSYDPSPNQRNYPMQVHLSRTVDPTEMSVVWVTTDDPQPVVLYSTSLEGLAESPLIQYANTSTYTRDQMCPTDASAVSLAAGIGWRDPLAAGIGWRDPGAIHRAILVDLEPATQYFYVVGSNVTTSISKIASFTTAPPPATDIDFLIFGDLGQADTDGSVGWTEWKELPSGVENDSDQPAAVNTTRSVLQDLTDGTVDNSTALVLIIGDVSYARGREALWDQFQYMIEPVASIVPVMTLLGNHEEGSSISYWPGGDSGGECGVAHQTRWPMPSPPSSSSSSSGRDSLYGPGPTRPAVTASTPTPWYSFEHGSVHFIMMSSEHAFDQASEQYAWLAEDLASGIDRTRTPWVVLALHRPMYVSSTSVSIPDGDMTVAALLRQELESLFNKYEVDLVFAGHHHDAQRTCPVFNQTCTSTTGDARRTPITDEWADMEALETRASPDDASGPAFGTVHIVSGASGQWNHVFLDPSPLSWLEMANTQVHGYHRVRTRGDQLTVEFVASEDRRIWDSVTITRGGRALRRAPHVRRNPSVTFQPPAAEAVAIEEV